MKLFRKASSGRIFGLFFLLISLPCIYLVLSAFQVNQAGARLELLDSGYPKAFFFRRSENVTAAYETWEKTFKRLGGIMGKTQNEELLERKVSLPYFQKFKARNPSQAVFLHYNGNARDPLEGERFFDGHWIYYTGTPLLENIPAKEGEMVIKVVDASLFKLNVGRYKNRNDDLALCRKNPDGSLDWHYAEQLKLVSADYNNNTLTVKRAQYGSAPRKFEAATTMVSPHAVEGPWGEKNNLLWLYNHAAASPKDKNGKSCDDVLIEEIAGKFKPGGELALFDGVEFDVLWNELKNENNTSARQADVNADGKGDNGLIQGVNSYSVGVFNFCKNLRQAMGPNKFIMADGMTAMFQRGVGYLNGIESEGWPHLKDPEVADWSGGWNRHLFWNKHAAQPVFNFINFKYALNIQAPPLGRQRLVWAVAQLLDAHITSGGYILEKPVNGIRLGITDEFVAGAKQQKYWLGKPAGPTVRLALNQPDLLAGNGKKPYAAFFKRITGDKVSATIEGNAIKLNGASGNLKFTLKNLPAKGPDLVISLQVKCDPRAGYPANMPRLLTATDGKNPVKMMTWMNGQWFGATFYLRDVKTDQVTLQFEAESNEAVWLKDITVHAYPDAAYRVFENGLVLANPALHDFEFDMKNISPGKKYARLQATAPGDQENNNGKPVKEKIMVKEREGLFLEVRGKD